MKKFTEQIVDTLKEGVEIHGTAYKLAKASGVQLPTLGRWLEGTPPRLSAVEPVLDHLQAQIVLPGQTVRDFVRITAFRQEDANAHDLERRSDPSVPESLIEYVLKRRHALPSMLFHPDKLEELEVDAQHALLFTVSDGDMWPSIQRGDQVLVDLRLTNIENGELYLVAVNNVYSLRRLTRRLSGLLMSADSAGEETVPPELEPKITILGKVVWLGKKL